jgi:hypothetical protein
MAQGCLAKRKISVVDEIDVAKGKRLVHSDIKASRPGRADLLAARLGPTGGLRADPRVGRAHLVGFNEEGVRESIEVEVGRAHRPC